MPYYTWTAGEEPTAAQVNERIRDQVVSLVTTAQRTAISTPTTGTPVYDTDLNRLYVYVAAWKMLAAYWVSALANIPTDKLTGQALYVTDEALGKVWDGSAWQTLSFQALSGASGVNTISNTTGYTGVAATNGTEAAVQFAVPFAGVVDKLYVVASAAPSAGKSVAYTVRKNAVSTSVTCTMADTAVTASDTTNTATFAAGDLFTLLSVGSGTPTTGTVSWSVRLKPAA